MDKLSTELHRATVADLKRLLQTLVPEYHPCLESGTNGNGNENGDGNGNGNDAARGVKGGQPVESTGSHPLVAH